MLTLVIVLVACNLCITLLNAALTVFVLAGQHHDRKSDITNTRHS